MKVFFAPWRPPAVEIIIIVRGRMIIRNKPGEGEDDGEKGYRGDILDDPLGQRIGLVHGLKKFRQDKVRGKLQYQEEV